MPRMFRLILTVISLTVIASTTPLIAGAYTIKAGDTPVSIAKKHGISVRELLKANKSLKPTQMRVGQTLTIPESGSSKAHPDKTSHKTKPTEKKTRPTTHERTTGHKTTATATPASHTVQRGETLGGIAAKYGVSTNDLKKANRGLTPKRMRIGQKLTIPGGSKAEKTSETIEQPKTKAKAKTEKSGPSEHTKVYTVRRHDTLKSVARKHHISTKELGRLNPKLGHKLHKGQKLIVPAEEARARKVSEPEPEEAVTPAEPTPTEPTPTEPTPTPAPTPTPTPEQPTPAVDKPTPHPSVSATPSRKEMGEAEVQFEKGIEFGKQNKFPKAVDSFDKAIRLNPNRADYYASRGHAHYYMKQYAKAITDYTQAIAKNPGFALAYSMRGLSLTRSGKYDEAIKDFNKAITLAPNEADYYKGRGFTYLHLKQSGPMCRDYQKACDLGDCELLESARKEKACP